MRNFRQLRNLVLMDKSWPRASNLAHALETELADLEDGSRRQDDNLSIFGDELFCATWIRRMHLIQDPNVQYLMLELIICGLRLCISGKIHTLRASGVPGKHILLFSPEMLFEQPETVTSASGDSTDTWKRYFR